MSLDDDPGPSQPPQRLQPPEVQPEVREVTDARTLRALAHPVRIAIIESLSLGGAMTATEVGERIGESPTTCSFHLRQLARYGFVEEAGGGKGRARPWRMTSIGMRLASSHDDPEAEIAAGALMRLLRERQFGRYRTWLETKATYPRQWQDAADSSQYMLYLTAAELEQLSQELSALLVPRCLERIADPSKRPPGSVPVEMLLLSYPISFPPADGNAPAGRGPG
jgi:DNA-binding transcriptional ArsR family regulator